MRRKTTENECTVRNRHRIGRKGAANKIKDDAAHDAIGDRQEHAFLGRGMGTCRLLLYESSSDRSPTAVEMHEAAHGGFS